MLTLVLRSISAVASKAVLLEVGASEDVVSYALGGDDDQGVRQAHVDREGSQETGLQGVVHGQPGQETVGKHEAEPIGRDIHGCQDRGFVPKGVDDVKGLKDQDGNHRVGDTAKIVPLLASHAKIEQDPADKTGAELDKVLDVKSRVGRRAEARVELTTKDKLWGEENNENKNIRLTS